VPTPLPTSEATPSGRRRVRWGRWIAGGSALLLVIFFGMVAQSLLTKDRYELAGVQGAWPQPFRWMCETLMLSPIRPTKKEVDEMNLTAGASLPVDIEDRTFGERLLKHYVAAGVDINAPDLRDAKHLTPLHYAAITGSGPEIRMLLDNGADPGRHDALGRTPLQVAREMRARFPTVDNSGAIALLEAAEARKR
jgi:hypothetical protein